MSVEICMHCDKKFELNDGFDNERSITCVDCLKRHFVVTEDIIKEIKQSRKDYAEGKVKTLGKFFDKDKEVK